MAKWIERIEATDSICEMEELIEEIALDDNLSNAEYEELYNMALGKVR